MTPQSARNKQKTAAVKHKATPVTNVGRPNYVAPYVRDFIVARTVMLGLVGLEATAFGLILEDPGRQA